MADPNLASPTLIQWLLGLVTTLLLILFGWSNSKANLAHRRIDEEINTITKCKEDINNEFSKHMTEPQVKDFVDRTIKPIENKIDAIHSDLKQWMREQR